MATLTEWQPYERPINANLVDGQFMSGAFLLLAAGPPRLTNIGGLAAAAAATGGDDSAPKDWAMPIGVVQNVGLSHNRNFSRFWELGSERSYFIGGRTTGQLQLSRVMYHGPSLLRMLYAYYADTEGSVTVKSVFKSSLTNAPNQHDVKIPPGYENIFLNLASDLFSQPIGLLMYFRDSNEATVSAIYMESCYIPSHQIATDSGATVIQESCAVQFERAVPVAVKGLVLKDQSFNPATGF
jgi:hypothetical protein